MEAHFGTFIFLDWINYWRRINYKNGSTPVFSTWFCSKTHPHKYGHNSTVKFISNLKKVITVCVKKGWLLKDPFYGFKMAVREVSREILTQEELDKIISKKISGRRMSVVKDIFLFSCYTGLAYVDVHKLKRSEIMNGIDGEKWIIINRKKQTPQPIYRFFQFE